MARTRASTESLARLSAGVFIAAAGLAHLYLIGEHTEVPIFTAFFALAGVLQVGVAFLILRRGSPRLYYLAMLGTAGLIGLYGVTRAVPPPFGHPPEPEAVDAFGLLVKSLEGLFIGVSAVLVRSSRPAPNLLRHVSLAGQPTTAHGERGIGAKGVGLIMLGMLLGGVLTYFSTVPQAAEPLTRLVPAAQAQQVREYTLVVEARQLSVGGKTWEAWTYNGTVPGPTLKGKVGDILRITLINKHELTHSIHTHLRGYRFEMDGSQANVIAGRGAGSMVSPNGRYVYEFPLTTAGIYYYHCHSADRVPIAMHIRMGLYGAIVVDEPDLHPAREFVLFYGEGQPNSAAPFVLSNRGIPGGEHVLEQLFKEKGFPGVAQQLNVTVTAFRVNRGDVVRLHVINIGDLFHSHHHHGFEHRSLRTLRGHAWAAAVLPLMPGQADTLEFRAVETGVWLIHCHVVSHADAGMIAVLIVE